MDQPDGDGQEIEEADDDDRVDDDGVDDDGVDDDGVDDEHFAVIDWESDDSGVEQLSD